MPMIVSSGLAQRMATTRLKVYIECSEVEKRKKPGSSNQSSEGTFLKDLWDLDIPSKIKHFLWRASNESLPTKKNLFRRQVTRTATCDCCHNGVEDTIHALWECQAIKETWWEDGFCRQQLSVHFANFRDLFMGILNVKNGNLAERFAYIAWSIWAKRKASRLEATTLTLFCLTKVWLFE